MIIIVLGIVFIQCVAMILVFSAFKKSYYGDEVYSYATSNSEETMLPVLNYDDTWLLNEWIDTTALSKSVTVTKDEIFSYSQINLILKDDAHPPFYFYLLHFFSSFFPGRFSWIPSIIINSMSLFLLLVYFYRLFLIFSKDRSKSVTAMIFFGFTCAVINFMTFTRNYTLMTAFTVIFTFYLFRAMVSHSRNEAATKDILLSATFLFLAAFTQYLSILFAFILIFIICFYYLLKRDFRFMLKTGISMSAAIAALVIFYNDIIIQLSSDQSSMDFSADYPYLFQLMLSLHLLFNEVFGIKTPTRPTMFFFWVFWGFVAVCVLLVIAGFLFRTDEWFKMLLSRLLVFLKSLPGKLSDMKVIQYAALLITVILSVMIISYKFKIYYFFPCSDRYLFILMPFFAIILLIPAFGLLRKKNLCVLLSLVLVILSLSSNLKNYLYDTGISEDEVRTLTADSDVLIYGRNHTSITTSLLHILDSDRTFVSFRKSFEENRKAFENGIDPSKPLYLLYEWSINSGLDENQLFADFIDSLKKSGVITHESSDPDKSLNGVEVIGTTGGYLVVRLR